MGEFTTENYHDPEPLKHCHRKESPQRQGPVLLAQARCLLFCKRKHLSATAEIKYVSKIFLRRAIIQEQDSATFFRGLGLAWQRQGLAQPCLTLWNPRDYSLPGSSVHGISQERILEWVAISYSRGPSWPRGQTRVSCVSCRLFTAEPLGKHAREDVSSLEPWGGDETGQQGKVAGERLLDTERHWRCDLPAKTGKPGQVNTREERKRSLGKGGTPGGL